MQALKFAGLAALTTLGLAVSTPVSTAHAATWHQGTPKILRGKWRLDDVSPTLVHLRVTKQRFYFYSMGPLYYLKNVHYQKVGQHAYKLRGYEYTHHKRYDTVRLRTPNAKHFQFKGIYHHDSWLDFSRR